jgi:predicted acyltransferase (DUF342 family)
MKRIGLTNILIMIIIILALAFVNLTYGTYRSFVSEQKRMRAFYITDAGINQAVWYLSTPPNLGGFGPNWRVKGLKRYFSIGSYIISVENGNAPGEILITSVGQAEGIKMMLQMTAVYGRSLPPAFNYAIFSGGQLQIGGQSSIVGNVYVNDDLTLKDRVMIINGQAITTPGYSIEMLGNPKVVKGVASRPFPTFPMLDTSFYYDKISYSKSMSGDVKQGDAEYNGIDLGGRTIFVNGNVTVKGDIKGRGTIVCTRNMTISGAGRIDDGAMFISNGKLRISGAHTVMGSAYFYSKQALSMDDNTALRGGAVLLSPTIVEIGSQCIVSGLVYGLSVNVMGGSVIEGSMVAENYSGGDKSSPGTIQNVQLKYNPDVLPLTVSGLNAGSEIIMRKPGSLREL